MLKNDILKVLLLFILFFLSACSEKEEIIIQKSNNRKDKKASVILRHGYFEDHYEVWIQDYDKPKDYNWYNRAFYADQKDHRLPQDTSLIQVKWINDNHLSISYHKKLRIGLQVCKLLDQTISYQEME